MRCFKSRVKKRQQTISELQVFSDDVFVVLSEAPRFLIVTVDGVMVAKKRRQKTNLIRTHQELAVRTADKTTHITADERLARESQRREHRHVQRQRVPGAIRIARPHRGISLDAGVACARDYEGPPVGL